MKKISEQAADMLFNKKVGNLGNTKVTNFVHHYYLELFDNTIAHYDSKNRILYVTDCGYQTVTTKDRLSAVLRKVDVGIFQTDYVWYIQKGLNGRAEKFSGKASFQL